ncbi:hypothetical protein JXB31_05060 [Candidatus Woesearchaeota archaeon]|nr:hypothetical protein [Candidatus Woesearchaeota archaeon]
MEAYIEKDDIKKKLKFRGTVLDLLKRLDINPAGVNVIRDREMLSNDDVLSDDDVVSIQEIFMGG